MLALVSVLAGCTRPAPPVIHTTTTTTTVYRPAAPATIETHAVMAEPAPIEVVEQDGNVRPASQATVYIPAPPPQPVVPSVAPVVVAPTPGVFVQVAAPAPTATPAPVQPPVAAPTPVVFPPETMQDVPLPTDALPFTSPAPHAPTR